MAAAGFFALIGFALVAIAAGSDLNYGDHTEAVLGWSGLGLMVVGCMIWALWEDKNERDRERQKELNEAIWGKPYPPPEKFDTVALPADGGLTVVFALVLKVEDGKITVRPRDATKNQQHEIREVIDVWRGPKDPSKQVDRLVDDLLAPDPVRPPDPATE